jgi:hypothetical protein
MKACCIPFAGFNVSRRNIDSSGIAKQLVSQAVLVIVATPAFRHWRRCGIDAPYVNGERPYCKGYVWNTETSFLWPLLFVPEHSQRSLAENSVGAGKPDDQREHHREEEADAKHLWMYAPREVEHIPNECPCQDTSEG